MPLRKLPMLLLFSLLLFATLSPAVAATWKGEKIEQEGIPHLMNPAEAMNPASTVELEELWRLGGDTDDEDEFFGIITSILADEAGNVYLLDSQLNEVKIFSAQGEYLRSIGREGEGPGEFRGAASIFFLPGSEIGVMQLVPGKIVKLTREGDPAGDHPIPAAPGQGFSLLFSGRSAGGNLTLNIGTNAFEEGKFTQTRRLARVDAAGEIVAEYLKSERPIEFANAVIDETVWDSYDNRWAMTASGKIAAPETWGEYAITVWGPGGEVEMVIERSMEHRRRSEAECERLRKIYEPFVRQIPNAQIKISERDNDIFALYARDDGSIWVQTSYGAQDKPDEALGVFDVFDARGRYVQEITLLGQGAPMNDGYFFIGNRLYVVTGFLDAALAAQGGGSEELEDEEAEPMAVICYKLDESVFELSDGGGR
jgi:hypothetical protein